MDKIEQVAAFAEQARINDVWWYEFGRGVGVEEGRAEANELIERIRLDRAALALLRPSGENCPHCGGWLYERGRS